jgi:hypothetical protein
MAHPNRVTGVSFAICSAMLGRNWSRPKPGEEALTAVDHPQIKACFDTAAAFLVAVVQQILHRNRAIICIDLCALIAEVHPALNVRRAPWLSAVGAALRVLVRCNRRRLSLCLLALLSFVFGASC